MKGTILILAAVLFSQFGYSAKSDGSNPSKRMTTLLHCGADSESGFNGWFINGLSEDVHIYFENKHLEIFSHQAGEYSMALTKKIDMVGFNNINLSLDFEEIENCKLHSATAYLSPDGKKWTAINKDAKNGTVSQRVEKMNCLYLRIIADVSFYSQGRFGFNRALVQGGYTKPNDREELVTSKKMGPAASLYKEAFFVFAFENNINIETKNEAEYEFVLSNISGQIVQREKSIGSKRFEAKAEKGVYFVSVLQDNKLITTKKVVLQ